MVLIHPYIYIYIYIIDPLCDNNIYNQFLCTNTREPDFKSKLVLSYEVSRFIVRFCLCFSAPACRLFEVHERGQGNINFPCSADHEQDWQPYPVDPYSANWSTAMQKGAPVPGTILGTTGPVPADSRP